MFDGIPAITDHLTQRELGVVVMLSVIDRQPQYKRQRKSSTEPLELSKRSFLSSLLTVVLEKLKWDEEADPEDMDEDDKADFEELRKVLGSLLRWTVC